MAREVWLVDAFTTQLFGGNVAGVVPDATGLTDKEMQAIAAELAASETAFVLPPQPGTNADLRLRYFTPTVEVDLCGHATIGSMCSLFANGRLDAIGSAAAAGAAGENAGAAGAGVAGGQAEAAVAGPAGEGAKLIRVETRVGVLPITVMWKDGRAWAEMGQAAPQLREVEVDTDSLAAWLGIRPDDFDFSLPLGVSSTGLWDLFVPVRSLAVMAKMQPDYGRLAAWNKELEVASTHVYTRETVHRTSTFHARDFSPSLGIPEDPATGTASGALTALLRDSGHVKYGQHVIYEQGFEIGRDSYIEAHVELGVGDDFDHVFVGGPAVVSVKGTLDL